jgi:hypothetical protein
VANTLRPDRFVYAICEARHDAPFNESLRLSSAEEDAVDRALSAIAIFLGAATAQAEVTPHDRLPTHILTCGGSVVTDIGGRLEGDTNFSSGTSVFFENGGSQVSYDKVAAIVTSKKGDHVLICLVFIPSNCPAGDDRGKIYTTTNLRTLESWTLPDSQHSCGGA